MLLHFAFELFVCCCLWLFGTEWLVLVCLCYGFNGLVVLVVCMFLFYLLTWVFDAVNVVGFDYGLVIVDVWLVCGLYVGLGCLIRLLFVCLLCWVD